MTAEVVRMHTIHRVMNEFLAWRAATLDPELGSTYRETLALFERSINAHANVEAAWALSEGEGVVVAVIDDGVLYVATTADLQLGKIVQLLRRIGIIVDFKTPWIDLGEPDAQSEVLDLHALLGPADFTDEFGHMTRSGATRVGSAVEPWLLDTLDLARRPGRFR